MSIRVLVADDHAVFVAGIRSVLEKADDISIIGHAKDGQEAIEATLREKPDVLVVDISMPGVSGIEATRRIRSDLPSAKILCLTMHSAEPFLTAALEAGASGYMLKDCALEELTTAIRSVVAHGSYFSPAVASIAHWKEEAPRSIRSDDPSGGRAWPARAILGHRGPKKGWPT